MEKQKKSSFVQAGEKYLIRFPEGMRDRIAEIAKANNRSMNAEIIARLERSFATEPRVQTSWWVSEPDPLVIAEVEKRAAEWGCSKTQALIRMTIEEVGVDKVTWRAGDSSVRSVDDEMPLTPERIVEYEDLLERVNYLVNLYPDQWMVGLKREIEAKLGKG